MVICLGLNRKAIELVLETWKNAEVLMELVASFISPKYVLILAGVWRMFTAGNYFSLKITCDNSRISFTLWIETII